MGIISERRRKERAQRARRRMMIIAAIMLLGALAMTPELRGKIASLSERGVMAFEESVQAEITLPKMEIYALQLGVFDSGERAATMAQQLQKEGVACIVWQREKMRIISGVAFSREKLNTASAGNHDAYVIKDVLPKIALRITAGSREIEQVKRLLETPDTVLMHLLTKESTLEELIADAREIALEAQNTHPEHALYTQLAESLINWCSLMEKTVADSEEQTARDYAAVTMCTLCRELRFALDQASSESTASAQRTPSTAADVMPPA